MKILKLEAWRSVKTFYHHTSIVFDKIIAMKNKYLKDKEINYPENQEYYIYLVRKYGKKQAKDYYNIYLAKGIKEGHYEKQS